MGQFMSRGKHENLSLGIQLVSRIFDRKCSQKEEGERESELREFAMIGEGMLDTFSQDITFVLLIENYIL